MNIDVPLVNMSGRGKEYTMTCSPDVDSMIFGGGRSYTIEVNINKKFDGALFSQLSLTEQVGILGHELAHIKDYESRDTGGVLERLYQYGFDATEFEREIDQMTIDAGLGMPLYCWANRAITEVDASYKTIKEETYLSPEEIWYQVAPQASVFEGTAEYACA